MNIQGKHYQVINAINNNIEVIQLTKECNDTSKHCNNPNYAVCTNGKAGGCTAVALTCDGGNSGGCNQSAIYCKDGNYGNCTNGNNNCQNAIQLPCHQSQNL